MSITINFYGPVTMNDGCRDIINDMSQPNIPDTTFDEEDIKDLCGDNDIDNEFEEDNDEYEAEVELTYSFPLNNDYDVELACDFPIDDELLQKLIQLLPPDENKIAYNAPGVLETIQMICEQLRERADKAGNPESNHERV